MNAATAMLFLLLSFRFSVSDATILPTLLSECVEENHDGYPHVPAVTQSISSGIEGKKLLLRNSHANKCVDLLASSNSGNKDSTPLSIIIIGVVKVSSFFFAS